MKQLTLRLSDDIHARLKAQAQREHRSMHAQLLHLIERGLADDQARQRTEGRADVDE